MSEAKDRILMAAIEEFGVYGYKNASTNRIMTNGGVSKGLIFHHYGNKEKLYVACARYVVDFYVEEFDKVFDASEKDFFKRYENVVAFKTKFIVENTFMGRFLMDVGRTYIEKTIPEIVEYTNEIYKERWDILSEGVDTSIYRKNIPAEKVTEHIMIVMDAYASRYHFERMSYEEVVASIDGYFREMEHVKDMLLYGVYEAKVPCYTEG